MRVDGCFLQHPEFLGAWDLLALADARRLPLATATVDGAFAAGCCPTFPTPPVAWPSWPGWSVPAVAWSCSTPAAGPPWPPATAGARATTDLLAPGPLRHQLQRAGWRPARYDDGPDRFLAVAERISPTVSGRQPG